MARGFTVLVVMGLLAGCQPNTGSEVNIPAPNLNGPVVVAPPAPAPAPVAAAPVPTPVIKPKLAFEQQWVPAVAARPWKWIVIHHSATPAGGAARFDREHREKGWDELGYHFVIGNGTDTADGLIEVGPRWPKQKWGAHAKTPDNSFNDFGIGICLVGDFDLAQPTPKQLQSVAKLVAYLEATYHIKADHVIGHGMVSGIAHGGTATLCPGRNLSVAAVRRMAGQVLADAGDSIEDDIQPASAQLLGAIDSDPAELLAPR
jgi:hypothetical protein